MKLTTSSLEKSTMRTAVGITTALLSLATVASASTILVDFSENSGVAGPNWNLSNTAGFDITNMVDSDGNATAIDLVFTTAASESGNWSVTGAPSPFDSVGDDAYNDGLFGADDVTTTFELRDLSPTDTYTITLFGSRDSSEVRTTAYTVTGSGAGSTLSLQTSGAGAGSGINHNIGNLAVFSDVSANGSNVIEVSFINTVGTFSYLNGMEISVIPEPGSFAMMMGGFSMLLIFVRRKMRG